MNSSVTGVVPHITGNLKPRGNETLPQRMAGSQRKAEETYTLVSRHMAFKGGWNSQFRSAYDTISMKDDSIWIKAYEIIFLKIRAK